MIYMDNAATRRGNQGDFNINSPYALEQKKEFEKARKTIARTLGVEAENIYFTSGGCEANSWALQRGGFKRIITTKIEHSSIMNCCKWLENHGTDVYYVNVDRNGRVDMNDLRCALLGSICNHPTLVSIMAVNNEIGVCQDLKAIRELIDEINEMMTEHEYPLITFHSDCVQAIGNIDVPFECLDMFSVSGHKFDSDFGVGFLYSKVPLEPLIFGGSQEQGIRGGTSNYESVIRMSRRLKGKYLDDINHIFIRTLIKRLRECLIDFDCVINTPEESKSNILSVSFKNVDAEALMIFLSDFGIYVSAGSACETDHKEPSHVLTAIGVPSEYINGTIRFSLSELIGEKDIEETLKLIKQYIGVRNEQ